MIDRLLLATLLTLWFAAWGLAGCAAQKPTPDTCAGWRPILPSRDDVLTLGTKQQILRHNEFGARQGCWTEP